MNARLNYVTVGGEYLNITRANNEGWTFWEPWVLDYRDPPPVGIGRSNRTPVLFAFTSDEEAIEHVKQRAAQGSRYHQRALRLHCFLHINPPTFKDNA